MNSLSARVVRGFAAAGASTLITAVMHAAGGGLFPHPLLLLTGIMLTGGFCIALTGRRVSLARMIPSVLATQGFFHLLFSMTGGSVQISGTTGHLHHNAVQMISASAHPAGSAGLVGGMTGAHLIAAVVTILALRFGESAFWGLFDTARLMLAVLLRFRLPAVSWVGQRTLVRVDGDGFIPAPVLGQIRSTPHRGPPLVPIV